MRNCAVHWRGRHRQCYLWLLVVSALALTISGVAAAQTVGGYDLTWSTMDGGGTMFGTGGGYSLGGTISV